MCVFAVLFQDFNKNLLQATLRSKVERMGGKVTGILTENVTHLVVKEVGSVKYFSAAHAGIALMTLDWIEHLWKHGQSRFVEAIIVVVGFMLSV